MCVFFLPLLTLHPSLAEDLKCTGLGSVRIPLTQIRGFSPQLEGQLRSLHCNIENTISLDNVRLWPSDNLQTVFYTVLELRIIPVTLNINQSQCNDCVALDYLITNFHSQRVKSYSVDFNGFTTWQFDNR